MAKEHLPSYHLTSTLPHESAKAADQTYSGLTFEQARVGSVGGGTIFAVWEEALTNQRFAKDILQASAHVYLDTPNPVRAFTPVKPFPFQTLDYDIPLNGNGEALQWAEMRQAYLRDQQWLDQHIAQRTLPGKHIIFAHHNVGVALEADMAQMRPNRSDSLIAMRYHSQLLPTTKLLTPGYYAEVYGKNTAMEAELWELQRYAIQSGDVHFFATQRERATTVEAISALGWLSREEAERAFLTVPIPIDTERFEPDDEQESRRRTQLEAFNRQTPSGIVLDPSRRYIGTVSRRDHEKNIWDLVKAMGQFYQSTTNLDSLPDTLVIGGPTNKPGAAKKEAEMWEYIASLPEKVQEKIHISSVPLPHEKVVHIMDMEVYPSWEESYNISEKQARAAGKLVALSCTAAGHTGTNKQDTAIWFDPKPLGRNGEGWESYSPIFEAIEHMGQCEEIRKKGQEHVRTNFSKRAILEKTFQELQLRFDGFFRKDQYGRLY